MNNDFLSQMLFNEVLGGRKFNNNQHSGCQASTFRTTGGEQMTNPSVRKHPLLLTCLRIARSCRLLDVALWETQNSCCGKEFYVSFAETWPHVYPLFYKWIWGRVTVCDSLLSFICCISFFFFWLVHLEAMEAWSVSSLPSFPGARRLCNPLNITC